MGREPTDRPAFFEFVQRYDTWKYQYAGDMGAVGEKMRLG